MPQFATTSLKLRKPNNLAITTPRNCSSCHERLFGLVLAPAYCVLIANSRTRFDNTEPTFDPYARARHVRYVEKGVVYHVVSRTRGNLFLMRPDVEGRLRRLVAGILAMAKAHFPHIANYALSMLSNHLHACLAALNGDPAAVAQYIGFIKRELSRRWKQESGLAWTGSIWDSYELTAVITPDRQIATLDYVLGQGVKEGLVESPRDWPGFHCADALVTGEPVVGFWFDGTAYGKAFHAEKAKKEPQAIDREHFYRPKEFTFDRLPALDHLTDEEYRNRMQQSLDRIVEQGRKARSENPVLGVASVCAMDPMTSCPVAKPPWFAERRKMVVWDDLNAPEVQGYIHRYRQHQLKYRQASRKWKQSEEESEAIAAFPEVCFIPGRRRRPIAHMESSTA